MIEREIKLEYPSVEAARAAVGALGLPALRPRRLQDDALYDTPDGSLRARNCALRLRRDGHQRHHLQGHASARRHEGAARNRDRTGDAARTQAILEALGYRVAFRYQKYREEFGDASCVVAIDETPVGIFVELEGEADRITGWPRPLASRPRNT